ncbi:MAG: enolase-phosphatase E1 [Pirellulaceae bacterium]|nr:MAG: enolase-phosphatase E1 [Pirellulaceae bacterium]
MIRFAGQWLLLDIEGTTSSIRFVYDEMFPYVRKHLDEFLDRHWGSEPLTKALDQMARDLGFPDHRDWLKMDDVAAAKACVRRQTLAWMDQDAKLTGLKALQGLVWESGFTSGQLRAHVYDDVPAALQRWKKMGVRVCIYSSGSVQAQCLFFRHTIHGDLLRYITAHFDTTTGDKKQASSYRAIVRHLNTEPTAMLFVSDVPAELDAAREAHLNTALCMRPGNKDPGVHDHPQIRTFFDIVLDPGYNERIVHGPGISVFRPDGFGYEPGL